MTSYPWPVRPLSELAEVRLGRQRSPKNHSGSQMRPYLRAANVGWSGLVLDDVKEMNFTDDEMATYALRPGDLLLGEASGSPGEVGKPALWKGELTECAFQNTLLRVRSETMEPDFLLHFFRHQALSGRFVEQSRGVGIHHLGRERLAKWPTPQPTLQEQRRIVLILEEHLSDLDDGVRSLRKAELRGRALKRSVLLSLIPESREWPARWRTETVSAAGSVELGRQRHPDWHHGPNMHPYLRVANVFEDRIDTSDLMEMHWPEDTFDRFKLRPGQILLNEGQSPQYLGRPAMYRGEPAEVAFTNSLLRFTAGPEVLPEFALLVFRRHMHAGRFVRESRITTNIAHLSASRLKTVEFPVPPLTEQERLVDVASERLEAVSRIESSIQAQRKRADGLRRAVLAAAFSGHLTGHGSDNDAISELAEEESA